MASSVPSYINTQIEQDYQIKPLLERITDEIITIFHNAAYFISLIPHFLVYTFHRPANYCLIDLENEQWQHENTGLFVFITGLNGHPTWAAPYLSSIQAEHPHIEVRIPVIPHGGDCSLEEASGPIVDLVQHYIQANPGKKICLIGISNGGRSAGYVETQLRNEEAAIRVTGIAGLFFGSTRMNALAETPFAHHLYSPAIIEEFPYSSPRAKALIEGMQQPFNSERCYEFYAAANDGFIPNFGSCLPRLNHGERHTLITRHGHMSIAGAICELELERAYQWMQTV